MCSGEGNPSATLANAAASPVLRILRVIALGDYVDRGPRTRETLGLLVGLRDEGGIGSEFLMGNHEEAVLREPIGFNPIAAEAARITHTGTTKLSRSLEVYRSPAIMPIVF